MIKLEFVKLNEGAKIPQNAHSLDAGIDFSTIEEGEVYPGSTHVFSTGLALKMDWDFKNTLDSFYLPSFMKESYNEEVMNEFVSCMNSWYLDNQVPYLELKSRSGLSLKGIHVGAGIIDCEYRGEIKIVLHNISKKAVMVNKGDKIAQGIVRFRPNVNIDLVNSLDDTQRGTNGFGSTGR